MEIKLTPAFRNELKAIHRYIHESLANPSAAARLVAEVKHGISRLASNPETGSELSFIFQTEIKLRRIVIRNYIVIYRVSSDAVLIEHIFHGSQDYISILTDGE